jgi:hypothetical protein
MNLAAIWGDTWRIGLTVIGLLAVLGVWALIIPNLTPFGNRPFTPPQVEAEKERSNRYRGVQKFSVRIDVVFFVWLVVEGAVLVPWLFGHYGLR